DRRALFELATAADDALGDAPEQMAGAELLADLLGRRADIVEMRRREEDECEVRARAPVADRRARRLGGGLQRRLCGRQAGCDPTGTPLGSHELSLRGHLRYHSASHA